ncbi:MAG: flippase-like domain-containing protein [Chloroflexi bacterium]|nr:flippase-like domain-containing protein [Chloroflexota bacterium]
METSQNNTRWATLDTAREKMRQPVIRRLAQVILIVVIVVFMVRYIQGQWDQIRDEQLDVSVTGLVAAQFFFLVGLTALPVGSWLALRALGRPLSKIEVWHAFFLSMLAKYLPGSIWSLPGRSYLYTQRGVPAAQSVASVFWETALMVSAAVLLGMLGLPTLTGYPYLPPVLLLLSLSAVVFIGGGLALQAGRVRAMLLKVPVVGRVLRALQLGDNVLTTRQLVQIVVSYVLSWLVIGCGLATLAAAFGAHLSVFEWGQVVGLFAGAWAVGFLVIGAPGGIGIRDAVLIFGMGHFVADPEPLAIAVLARLAWTVSEIVGVLLARLVFVRHNKRLHS